MFSRLFPTTHSRRGEQTKFIEKVMLGEKIHTIRRQYDRWKHVAEKCAGKPCEISLCQWRATPRRSNHVQVGLIEAQPGVQRLRMKYNPDSDSITAIVDDNKTVNPETLAENEGLTIDEFKEWFFGRNRNMSQEFKGCILHLTQFRYD